MAWAAVAPGTAGFRYLVLAWLSLTATIGVGFGAVWVGSPADAQLRLGGIEFRRSGPVPSDPPAPPPPSSPFTVYGGLRWSLTEARSVARADQLTGHPIVVVELVVANLTADTRLRARKGDLAVVWPDGRRDNVDRFEQVGSSRSFTVEPGQARMVTAVFKPRVTRDVVLEDMMLEIGEPGRIPASLPLVGPAAPSAYPSPGRIEPLTGSAAGPPPIVHGPGPAGSTDTVVARSVSVDIDAGPYRAALGRRLLSIDVAVTGRLLADAIDSGSGFWRLEVDGVTVDPTDVSHLDHGPLLHELRLLFVIDADWDRLGLSAGAESRPQNRFRIEAEPDPAGRIGK